MNDQDKTREELLQELQDLKQLHDSLKETYDKKFTKLQEETDLLQTKLKNIEAVFVSSPAAMLIIDEKTNIKMVNRAAKKLCEGDDFAILNHRPGNVLHCVHSYKDPRGCGFSKDCHYCDIRNGVEAVIANGGAIHGAEVEVTLVRGGKSQSVWLNVGIEPILAEGKKHWCIVLDEITKQKQVEEALQESQLLLKSSIESIKDTIIFSINTQYDYLYFNKLHQYVMLNSYGVKIKLAMKMLDCLTNEEDRIKAHNNFNRALKGESHITIEEYGRIDRYYYETRYNPILNDQNEIIGATAFSTNVTARRRAEQALLESEHRWRKLVQTIPDEVALYDQEGNYLFLNHFADGFSNMDIEGKKFTHFLADEYKSSYVEAFNNARTSHSTQYVEHIAFDDNRNMCYYESYFVPIFENDQFENMMVIDRDITQRIESENKIKESEANARAIMESTDEIMILMTREGILIDCNEANARRLGIAREELLGKNIFTLLPKDIAEKRYSLIQQVLSTGKPVFGEDFRAGYWNEFAIHPIFIDNKMTDRVTIFSKDITERKKAEEILHQSDERFRVLLQNVPAVSIQSYSPDGTTLSWNLASEKLYGYTAQEAIGKNLVDLIIPPEMRKYVELAIKQMAETAQPIPASELSLMRKDGSRVCVFSSHAIVQSKGKPQELFCMDIDLTERIMAENALKESEELNRLFFENTGEAIFLTKPDGSISYANNEACRIFGRTKTELCELGRSAIVDLNDPRLEAALEERKRTGKFKGELNFIRKDGSSFPVEVTSTIFKDSTGNDRTSLIIIDLTERKKVEETLKQSEVRLNELIDTKDKFFSIIAHDLRSPFNSFLGLTQIMAEELPSLTMSQVQEMAVSMRNSAANLYRLIENLLQWSQIQKGAIAFNPQEIQLQTIVNESIEMFRGIAKNKKIEITTHIPDGLIVVADDNMLQTILRNFVSNAVKFTPKGGKIHISCKNGNESSVEISIVDSGIGMSKEMVNNLFCIDTKITRIGTDGELSTGLGLLLCKEFIEKHGGQFWVISEPEKGSEFHFTIPAKI